MAAVEVRAEHYTDIDVELLMLSGNCLVAMAREIIDHHCDGDGWVPGTDDPAAIAASAGGLLDFAVVAVADARRWHRDGTGAALLRAIREPPR